MVRARSGKTVLRNRKRMRKLTKGFCMSRHNLYRQSAVTLMRAGHVDTGKLPSKYVKIMGEV